MVTGSPQRIYAGWNFTLDCIIILSMDVNEVLGSLETLVKWSGPVFEMMTSEVKQLSGSLMYSTSILINSANHSHAGNYTCAAQIRAVNSLYLTTSLPKRSESVEIIISMLIALSLIFFWDIVLS
jgi:hypothetical protein